jgi:hypothetical protein
MPRQLGHGGRRRLSLLTVEYRRSLAMVLGYEETTHGGRHLAGAGGRHARPVRCSGRASRGGCPPRVGDAGVDWKGEEEMGIEKEASTARGGGDGELELRRPMGRLLEPAYSIHVDPTPGSSHYTDNLRLSVA